MAFVVGLTGGIGSGKSRAADAFAALGAEVVDTDAIAHQLTAPGGAALGAIVETFGAEALGADGAMDRSRMRERVFRDPAARQQLEAILHPMIRIESQRRVAAARAPYVVLVVPLLVESPGYRDRVKRVLVVDCPEEQQLGRVGTRSNLAPAEVRRIIATQVPRARRLAAADDVIDNSGDIEALEAQVLGLHRRYLELARAAQS
ncbi:MAG: dephospho-CoA kinase [Betaproteobacteria bacterium]|nr:dephospho-CoA kinase [Betaproteobacteria bacterium]